MTRAQTFRRVLFWALLGGALARLWVLGESRSWAVVGPVALKVTGLVLAAWFFHVLIHEAGHLLASRALGFQVDELTIGPLEWSARERAFHFAGLHLGGKIGILPIGAVDLRRRLRLVAAAGPAMTLLAVLGLGAAWLVRAEPLASPLGVALVTGGLVLLSAATPGRFRAATAVAGNDVDQILATRPVLAHWSYLAVVQAVLAGKRPLDVTATLDFPSLLPPPGAPAEPITLVHAVHHLERGEFDAAKARLDDAAGRLEGAVPWVHTDVFHQRGALAALVDGDLDAATRCLEVVRQRQSLPWYGDLLEACIAKAGGDEEMARLRLGRWLAEARAAAPAGRLALGGNEWILERLEPGLSGASPAAAGLTAAGAAPSPGP